MADPRYKKAQVVEAVKRSRGIISVAARALGCARITVYEYMNRYPEVKAALEEAREVSLDHVENRLMDLCDDTEHKDHFPAVRYFLRTQGKHRGYTERQEITGADGAPLVSIADYMKAKKAASE